MVVESLLKNYLLHFIASWKSSGWYQGSAILYLCQKRMQGVGVPQAMLNVSRQGKEKQEENEEQIPCRCGFWSM